MKLYELAGNYNSVWEMIDNDDADLQIIEDTLQCIEASIEIKAENTVSLLKNLEVYSNGLGNEIKRLQAKQLAISSKATSIGKYLFGQLDLTGLTEIKTNIANIKKQKNPASVQINDEKLIPAKYQTVIPQSYKISKVDIAKDLKAGVKVAGCELKQSTRWVIK